MIAVYCPEDRQSARVLGALVNQTTRRNNNWGRFAESVAGGACAVIMVDWLEGNPVLQRIVALRAQYPFKPFVLVTRKDADNVRLLCNVDIDEVVWTEEVEESLAAVVKSAREHHTFRDIAAMLQGAEHMRPRLRDTLSFLFRSPAAITSVGELASAVGCDRRTLWRLWVSAAPRNGRVRLQDIIDWNLLLRGAAMRAQSRSWVGIAAQLTVHEHTLARVARRLLDMSLREVADIGADQVAKAFQERVLAPLLRVSDSTASAVTGTRS